MNGGESRRDNRWKHLVRLEDGPRAHNRRGGAPEGAPAPRTGRRGAFAKVPQVLLAPFRRSASLRGGKQEPGWARKNGQENLAIRAVSARSRRGMSEDEAQRIIDGVDE